MRNSGKEYVQSCNVQAAVDCTIQVIVAQSLSNNANYMQQFAPHDQNAFDPKYNTMPLEAFVPMLQRVMQKPISSIYQR